MDTKNLKKVVFNRKPDFKGDGLAVWTNQTKTGKPYLAVKVLGGKAINCFMVETKDVAVEGVKSMAPDSFKEIDDIIMVNDEFGNEFFVDKNKLEVLK